jgi:hypothetical protein
MLWQYSHCFPLNCVLRTPPPPILRVNAARTKVCAFADTTGALRSADCAASKRLVYCEYDLSVCP